MAIPVYPSRAAEILARKERKKEYDKRWQRERARNWTVEQRERRLEYQRRYNKANGRAARARYLAKHPGIEAETHRKWRSANLERSREIVKQSYYRHVEKRRASGRVNGHKRYYDRVEAGLCGCCGKEPRRYPYTLGEICWKRAAKIICAIRAASGRYSMAKSLTSSP